MENPEEKNRHGCLTTFFLIGIIIHVFLLFIIMIGGRNMYFGFEQRLYLESWMYGSFIACILANIVGILLLLYARKIGYFIYLFSSLFIFYMFQQSGIELFYAVLYTLSGAIILSMLMLVEDEGTGKKNWEMFR